ncbi:hypothetical protein FZI91_01230 [Mycobacterium sp. CBMA271]|uniref:hypothetical protein n=1 Tax=unclassified Mycobacteroides TaxID=2618759 RepID=UPI0012DC9720|nr:MULTISPECIES: hypothetical protein [unclassified Mycobacteroides]MUM19511.1 hypothetical protein [Mycobacteroides sp. CBMA 326]MUM20331.1 hypothetical protein [Mycobacteroides sp. CBMA 271]
MNTGVESLGWPSVWPRKSAAVWAVRVILGLLLLAEVAMVVAVPIAFNSFGKLGMGLMVAGSSFVLVPVFVMQLFLLRTRFRKLPRTLRADGDRIFLPDISEIVGVMAIAIMAIVFVPYVSIQTTQSADVANEFPLLWVMLVTEWVLVGFLVIFLGCLVWNLRTVRPGLEITATGVRRQTLLTERSIAWDQLFRVDPEQGVRFATWLVGSARFQMRRTGLFSSQPRERAWAEPLIAAKYRIDPPLLLAILRYYHLHPEHRGELESAGARDRIRRVDFPGIDLSLDPGVPRSVAQRYSLRGPGS